MILFLITLFLFGCNNQKQKTIEAQYNSEWLTTLNKLGINELHVCEGENGWAPFTQVKQYTVIIQEGYWCMFRSDLFVELNVSSKELEHYDGLEIYLEGENYKVDYDSGIKEVFYPEEFSLFLSEATKAYTERKTDMINKRSAKKETLAEAWRSKE